MKNYLLAIGLGVSCLLPQAWGQQRIEPRPYIRGNFGLAITENTDVHSLPGVGDARIDFDPGIHFNFAGGAMFGDYFALEAETGFILNEIDSISGFNDVDAWVSQVPLLMNLRFEFKNQTGITPFLGAGAGGSIVGINIDHARSPTTSLDGDDADWVFAWQAFAGAKYELNEQLSVGIMYKYFWSDNAKWQVEGGFPDIRFDGTHSHLISAVVTFKF
jgi:opacity protein-like surface antigen